MRSSIAAILVFALSASITPAHAVLITAWDFNALPDGTATGTTSPSSGVGTWSAIGGVSDAFFSGSPGDPAPPSNNSGFSTTSYPAQGTNSGTAGVEIAVSTVGFTNITFTFDARQSARASRHFQMLVSTDGTTFAPPSGGVGSPGTPGAGNTGTVFDATGLYSNDPGDTSQTFVEDITYTFTPGSAVENNPNFKVRLVSTFAPSTSTYVGADTGLAADYSTLGTLRLDMVNVMGTIAPIPEPGAFLFGGLICSVVAIWKLRQRFISTPG